MTEIQLPNETAAVEKAKEQQSIGSMIQALRPEIARALPKGMDADRLARLALTVLRTTPKLALSTPASFAGALMMTSALGLEPGVNGESYLVPYRNKRGRSSRRVSEGSRLDQVRQLLRCRVRLPSGVRLRRNLARHPLRQPAIRQHDGREGMSDDLVRKVSVTIEVTTMYTGTYEIDLPDYLDWLGDDSEDSPAKMTEYLRSGIDVPEVISAVYDSARLNGTEEVYDSSIDSVRFIRDAEGGTDD